MAGILRPAGLRPYQVQFTSGGKPGHRTLWATSEHQARQLLTDYPSCFGLCETVTIHRVSRLGVREQTIAKDRHAA